MGCANAFLLQTAQIPKADEFAHPTPFPVDKPPGIAEMLVAAVKQEEPVPTISEELVKHHVPVTNRDFDRLQQQYSETYELLGREPVRNALNISSALRRELTSSLTSVAASQILSRDYPTALEQFNLLTAPPGAFTTPQIPVLNPAIAQKVYKAAKDFVDKKTGRFSGTLTH